jgi:uncharacterized protein (DUF934 family)
MSERRIIRDGVIVPDAWTILDMNADDALPAQSRIIVPLAVWQAQRSALLARGEPLGVWLTGADDPLLLAGDAHLLSVIAIHFPTFKDGRGYSSAFLLRDRLKYQGQLRAFGDVLRDQLFYMKRVGFNAFVVREDSNLEDALKGLHDFSDVYQGSIEQPVPLFRRRPGLPSEAPR